MKLKTSELIYSDFYRYKGKKCLIYRIIYYFVNPQFRFHVALRMASGKGITKIIGLILWRANRTKRNIQISYKTKIGYGLYIGHGGPIVINPTAVLGNNINLSQFVTIGTNHSHAATIGDNTYIGPNVCIVEDVIIGSNCTIGAGAVVTKNIPDNSTAVGNYARVINTNNPGRYTLNNRYYPKNNKR